MAGTRAYIQVAVVLVAALAAVPLAAASPVAGLGNVFSNERAGGAGAGSSPDAGSVFADAITFPKQVVSSFLGGNRRPDAAADHHPGHTTKAPTAAPTAAPTTKAATTAQTTTKAESAATTTTTASPTRAASAAPPTTAAPSPAEPTASESSETALSGRTSEQQPATANYTEAELVQCRQKWLEVTNSTVNQNLDILTVLLDYGGFPGQIGRIEWVRNATEAQPDRWSYFYGDTDYKTYIRTERGEILSSKRHPVMGTTPDNISGDIYWSPPDFCGKLRHAKYTQWAASECETYDEAVSAETGRCYFPSFTAETFKLCRAGTPEASLLADSSVGGCDSESGHKNGLNKCLASLCGR